MQPSCTGLGLSMFHTVLACSTNVQNHPYSYCYTHSVFPGCLVHQILWYNQTTFPFPPIIQYKWQRIQKISMPSASRLKYIATTDWLFSRQSINQNAFCVTYMFLSYCHEALDDWMNWSPITSKLSQLLLLPYFCLFCLYEVRQTFNSHKKWRHHR